MTTNKMQLYRFIYLFVISSTCFGRCLRPSPGARDHLQLLVLFTDVAACSCHEWDGTPFHLIHDISRQHHRWKIPEAVRGKYSHVLLMMGEDIVRNM